jgi:uncharacterized protein with ParB-like and HNH nuclease domain
MENKPEWFIDDENDSDEVQISEYDLTSTPNDFNVTTIYHYLKSGVIRIPAIQRNFVWDIKRSSKLIESLILGLPVPQIFLYEEGKNVFSVIDGQQRLMSIYYFIKQKFPRDEKHVELRKIILEHGEVPEEILNDDKYFVDFKLNLPVSVPNTTNKFSNLKYSTLGDSKSSFELRPIRNVIVKQNSPKDDNSAIFEIFNRLNTGGVNLFPQEIRASLYHSEFFEMLYRINELPQWRKILNMPDSDEHSKDIEILLRSYALLIDGENYKPLLIKFLNSFSKKSQNQSEEKNKYLEELFLSFLKAFDNMTENPFTNKNRFVIILFEAVFVAICEPSFKERGLITKPINFAKITELAKDPQFVELSQKGTTKSQNMKNRLKRAREILQ